MQKLDTPCVLPSRALPCRSIEDRSRTEGNLVESTEGNLVESTEGASQSATCCDRGGARTRHGSETLRGGANKTKELGHGRYAVRWRHSMIGAITQSGNPGMGGDRLLPAKPKPCRYQPAKCPARPTSSMAAAVAPCRRASRTAYLRQSASTTSYLSFIHPSPTLLLLDREHSACLLATHLTVTNSPCRRHRPSLVQTSS